MNAKNLLVAAVLVSASALSFASTVNADGTQGKTRAEVRAELVQAGQQGLLDNDSAFPVQQPFTSTKTRAQVKAEMLQAKAQQAASGRHVSPEE